MQDQILARYVREELYAFSPRYRRVFDDAGVAPTDIRTVDDLRRLPFTTKQDLLAAQEQAGNRASDFVLQPSREAIQAHWGFWRKIALALGGTRAREVLAYHYTPNFLTFTTGRSSAPVALAYTPHDLDVLGEAGARAFDVIDLGADARVVNAFPFAPHLAFWMATLAGFRAGRMTVPTGGGKVMGTRGNLDLIERLRATVLVATPGFAYHLARTAEGEGRDLSSLDTVVLGAERVTPAMKHRMLECLQACGAGDVRFAATYGFTEARMAFAEPASGIDESPGYVTYPDLAVIEVIDPDTLEPVGEGEDGEVVFTTISGHGTAVCRYRTGDLAIGGITYEPYGPDGLALPRISADLRRLSDRHTLDLAKVKGTLVDLSHVGEVLGGIEGVEEWQVVLRKKDDDPFELDELVVRVSARSGTARAVLAERIGSELVRATEVTPNEVDLHTTEEMLEFLGMESEMKEKRFLDLRPKG